MYRFSFFLISFICSIFLFISPVLADEEIEIDNDFLIEEEIEIETQEEVVEEHIEDIEEEIEVEEIFEDDTTFNDDFINNYDVNKIVPNVGDYCVYSYSTTGNSTYYYYSKIFSDYPFIEYRYKQFLIQDGLLSEADYEKFVSPRRGNDHSNYDLNSFFNSSSINCISTFNDGSNINLDNLDLNFDNTLVLEKLDNVLNTFYIMVFIVCTILGFLLAYIFVKMLFKI